MAIGRAGTTNVPGARAYSPAYGGIPQVPNLIDIYGQSTAANQAMLPGFINIGGQVTGANQQELLNNLRVSLPGYDASVAKSMGNIGALQRGEIPLDVRQQLQQQAAERGVMTGSYDSPNANAALLRAMGLTSLGLEGEGEKQMSALVGRTPQAQPFDVSKLMMSPTDLYEQQLLANVYRAAPEPRAAAQQLIADQMSAYDRGRGGNVPSYSAFSALDKGSPYVPIPRSDYIPSGPALGALGPFDNYKPTPYSPIMGNLQAGGGSDVWPPPGIPGATVRDVPSGGGYGDIGQTMLADYMGGYGAGYGSYELPSWLTGQEPGSNYLTAPVRTTGPSSQEINAAYQSGGLADPVWANAPFSAPYSGAGIVPSGRGDMIQLPGGDWDFLRGGAPTEPVDTGPYYDESDLY